MAKVAGKGKRIALTLHPKQMLVYQSKARFRVVVAGRRWGKCLASDTRISMADGSERLIKDVRQGDEVLTLNEKTHEIETRKVLNRVNNGVRQTVTVHTKSRNLQSTPNHPHLVNGSWKQARFVRPGDFVAVPKRFAGEFGWQPDLLSDDIVWGPVISRDKSGLATTWDLSIEGNHNFIANGVVTHNTALSRVLIINKAQVSRRKIWYVAPTYRMAKKIMWRDLQEALPKEWIKKINETTLMITLVNGTIIELLGADKPDSLRGVGIHFLVLDEFQDISEETWTEVLRPTLADTGGHAIFIGTPKSYNHLYDLYMLGQDETNRALGRWESWQFATSTSPFVPESELRAARKDMDEKSYLQEFEASFETMAGRVYYPFDRNTHVGDYPFDARLPIWVGMDFNLDPMSTVILQPQPSGELWAVDEVVLFSSNTQETCAELDRRLWRYQHQIAVYPDPAGGQRQHARGETDLDILRECGFKRLKYRRKHPFVIDRINAVNRMLCAADGTVRLRVDQRCRHLIESFEQTIYKPGSREVNKAPGIEHSADACGYCIELEYPVRRIEISGLSL